MYAATAFALAAFAPASHAAGVDVLNEGFGNVGGLSGWVQVNNSVPAGAGWFQGNSDVLLAESGPANAYIANNYLAAQNGSGTLDSWLITPALMLSGNTLLSFFTADSAEPGFADKLEVRFSSGNGSGTDGFTTLLKTVGGPAGYPDAWTRYTASVMVNGTGRFAFRYLGDAQALSYIGIDTVRVVTAIPEPSAYLMMVLGLGALTVLRRKLLK